MGEEYNNAPGTKQFSWAGYSIGVKSTKTDMDSITSKMTSLEEDLLSTNYQLKTALETIERLENRNQEQPKYESSESNNSDDYQGRGLGRAGGGRGFRVGRGEALANQQCKRNEQQLEDRIMEKMEAMLISMLPTAQHHQQAQQILHHYQDHPPSTPTHHDKKQCTNSTPISMGRKLSYDERHQNGDEQSNFTQPSESFMHDDDYTRFQQSQEEALQEFLSQKRRDQFRKDTRDEKSFSSPAKSPSHSEQYRP
jgi:hypothetical protein